MVYMLNDERVSIDGRRQDAANVGGGTHGDHHDLWIDPDDPQHIVIGNDGGGAVSTAGGTGWTRAGHPDRRSTTTSSRRSTSPITSAARSRTAARVCLPSDSGRSAAAARRRRRRAAAARAAIVQAGGRSPATSRRTRRTPTSSSPAANNGAFLDAAESPHRRAREVNPYPRSSRASPRARFRSAGSGRTRSSSRRSIRKSLYTSSQRVWKTTNGGQTWTRSAAT